MIFARWHSAHNFPVLPWSAQARGFFLDGKAMALPRHDTGLTRPMTKCSAFGARKTILSVAAALFNWPKKSVSAPFRSRLPTSSISRFLLCTGRPAQSDARQDSLDAANQASSEQVNWLDLRIRSGASAAPKNATSDYSKPRAASRSALGVSAPADMICTVFKRSDIIISSRIFIATGVSCLLPIVLAAISSAASHTRLPSQWPRISAKVVLA